VIWGTFRRSITFRSANAIITGTADIRSTLFQFMIGLPPTVHDR